MKHLKIQKIEGKKIKACWKLVGKVFVLLLLFYKSAVWMLLMAGPILWLGLRKEKKIWEKEKRWQINLEFKDMLQGIAAALNAGYSIENALKESRKDLLVLYGESALILREMEIMLGQLQLNQPLEIVFDELAVRTQVEDIRSFSEIFRIAKRSGGDLVAITRSAARQIGSKVEVNREIQTMIAGKKLEGAIMNIVPLGMIFYFWTCSPGFLDSCYQTISGHLMMTIFLIVYLVAYEINQRICQIM